MASMSTWFRYLVHKLDYSVALTLKSYRGGQISDGELLNVIWKTLFNGRLTCLFWTKGQQMVPTVEEKGSTLLIRRIPYADPTRVFVGDAVILKDPNKSDKFLIRRLAGTGGYEMVSSDNKEEPFVLKKDQCWVVAENGSLKAKEAYDSRTFGPVSTTDIVGRAIYCLRTAVDHGPVKNSRSGMRVDSPVLAVELDVDELVKNQRRKDNAV